MSNRHLWLRSKRQHAILKIRHQIIKSIRDFDMNEFTLVDTLYLHQMLQRAHQHYLKLNILVKMHF